MEVEEVNDTPTEKAIDEIADDSRIKETFGNRCDLTRSENRLALPDQKREGDKPESGKRPDLALKHPPGTTAVLYIGEIEHARYDNRGRRPLQAPDRKFLGNGIQQQEMDDNGKYRQKPLH